MTIFAPAGYGKTTLLAQAAETDGRPFAWVSLEQGDNDPVVLITHLVEALERITKVGPALFGALRLPPSSLWSTAVPRVGATFASIERPAVVVLDDLHVLRAGDSLDVVAALSAHVPRGSQLMLAGREEPQLRLARLQAERAVAALGRDELALNPVEAGALLRRAGLDLAGPEVAELTRQTEGWPAALYLAALSLRDGGTPDREAGSRRNGGPPGHLADYVRTEVLSRMPPEQLEFLMRTAVLERMCGSLCDAVLEQTGSAARLESVERSNRLLVRLDGRREWYRYHHLFREVLTHELELREPGIAATLNRRAAAWCEEHGAPEAAIEYAFAAGDFARAVRLVSVWAVPVYQSGRLETARSWIERINEAGLLEQYPAVAVLGAWTHGVSGQPAQAERWAAVAEEATDEERQPDGSSTIEPWLATLRASMCRHGVEQMRADARRGLELAPAWSPWRAVASVMLGISLVLAGDHDRADDALADAVEVTKEVGMHDSCAAALAQRSLLAATRGDFASAERFAQDSHRVVADAGLDEYMTSAPTYAALGRVALHRRDFPGAQAQLVRADRLRPLLTYFMPFLGVQVRLELVRERIALGDPGGALILQRELDQLLRRVPALGVLVQQAGELSDQIKAMRALGGDWAPLLTEAELRVLPLLATHLTIAEIAQRQYVSRGTVKTQAISIYRKLGVTKRGEAVERAAELGLIDAAAVPPPRDFYQSG